MEVRVTTCVLYMPRSLLFSVKALKTSSVMWETHMILGHVTLNLLCGSALPGPYNSLELELDVFLPHHLDLEYITDAI